MWLFIGLGILLIAIGVAVHIFKCYFLISGYNTMSKEKQKNVGTEGLGRLIGIYSYVTGGAFIIMGVLQALGFKSVFIPAIIFFIASTFYFLIRAQKYDGNIYDENGKIRKGAGKKFAVPIIITAVSLIFVVVLLFFSLQPTEVTFHEYGIEIQGIYGDVYNWESIESVELNEELPDIKMRTNGAALGSKLKGHFKTKELGSVKLFVDAEKPPFIYLKTDDGIIIFNLNDAEETQAVFKEILRQT